MSSTATSSTGELNLSVLLASMSPVLDPRTYTFATLAPSSGSSQQLLALMEEAEMLYKELEGWTFILPQDEGRWKVAFPGMECNFACKRITLNVHSSLDAVGFLARITTRLAERLKIGVNPVSGYYHDHLFVPLGTEDAVFQELKSLSEESRQVALS